MRTCAAFSLFLGLWKCAVSHDSALPRPGLTPSAAAAVEDAGCCRHLPEGSERTVQPPPGRSVLRGPQCLQIEELWRASPSSGGVRLLLFPCLSQQLREGKTGSGLSHNGGVLDKFWWIFSSRFGGLGCLDSVPYVEFVYLLLCGFSSFSSFLSQSKKHAHYCN